MHFVQPESSGPQGSSLTTTTKDHDSGSERPTPSSSLPFGACPSLSSIVGPTYLTAQTLVQHVSYVLSDKIFSYSPDTFDLDLALAQWTKESEKNGFGFQPGLQRMDTRAGAGSIALGYMFSPDYDLSKRHIPQAILAPSATLNLLRPTLDQLSLLYNVSNPIVLHVPAADYAAGPSSTLVPDYVVAQDISEDLGFNMISSTSTFEAQHISLLATLMSKYAPSIHVYDGINVARDTTRAVDILSQIGLHDAYSSISKSLSDDSQKDMDIAGKVVRLLHRFNDELGTDYRPFEYYGHPEADSVMVVFGSVEGSLAAQTAHALANNDVKVGAINVRLYRPFVEDAFLDALPKTTKRISVLGQMESQGATADGSYCSRLYTDVLATTSFSPRFRDVLVIDQKYPRETTWTPGNMMRALRKTQGQHPGPDFTSPPENPNLDILGPTVSQYSFWDTDDSTTAGSGTQIASYLSRATSDNVALRVKHDNLVRGGAVRTDVRFSPRPIEASYSVTAATTTYVGDEQLFNDVAILASAQDYSTLVVKMPGAKDQDMEKFEKRIPPAVRNTILQKRIKLLAVDPSASSKATENSYLEGLMLQLGFLRLTQDDQTGNVSKLELNGVEQEAVVALLGDLENAFRHIPIPASWKLNSQDNDVDPTALDISTNSFVGFDKIETRLSSYLKSWVTAAKGLLFKEATGTDSALRPDLGAKTFTVYVKEHRRLTPKTYDRNIFHIDFDLADSGLEYNIGEALGIHAENDKTEVEEFIKWYGLDPDGIVEVASRENPNVLENRTVYQALMQNVDIFGRPPKRFYEALADFTSDEKEKKELLSLGGTEGAAEFKRRAEVDTITYADILLEFPSAHPSFNDIVHLVSPMKRREYSIASSQKVQPNSVSLLIVTVGWVDPQGRDRFGQATRYLNNLAIGAPVTVSVKPSVMKLPPKSTAPVLMAGLGTGLAPFRAFAQERAWQKQQGQDIGSILLYMGSRHQREEYLYGEEWEAYKDAGVITLLGRAFSRDQPQKVYIQDRMRQTMDDICKAYLEEEGSFYLCGPTWPVPDVTEVLQEAVQADAKRRQVTKRIDSRKEIEKLKDESRYVLEVY